MTTRLFRHNGGYALQLDPEMLGSMQIDPDGELSVRAEGRCLIVAPAEAELPHEDLGKILEWINRRFGTALRNLA